MSQYSPIRTADPDLTRVQDRIRDTAQATTGRLDDLQSQIDANSKLAVVTVSANAISDLATDVTIANTTAGMVIQLPDATKVTKQIKYKNTSSTNVLVLKCIVLKGTQQLINTLSFANVAALATATIVSDGLNYHTI